MVLSSYIIVCEKYQGKVVNVILALGFIGLIITPHIFPDTSLLRVFYQ